MAYSISQAQDDLAPFLHGTDLSKVKNVFRAFEKAARNVLSRVDPKETIRVAEVAIYDGVYDYAPPNDLKGTKLLDIRPQGNRAAIENVVQRQIKAFDIEKGLAPGTTFSVEWDDAVKILRVSKSLGGNLLLHDMDSTTANGAWSASGGATSLAADSSYKTQGGASLSFNVGATGGTITNSSVSAIDLTNHLNVSSLFLRLYLPTSVSSVTNVILRWGTNDSNYYTVTATAPHIGSFKTGWQWVRFDWSSATTVGSPTITSIKYLLVTVTTTAAITAVKVDEIRSVLPVIHEVVYYSKFLFRDSASSWAESVTNADTSVNLDTDSYNLFLYESAVLVLKQVGGSDHLVEAKDYEQELAGLYAQYRRDYPSERIKPRQSYYAIR